MLRAYLIDMTVLCDYARGILALGIFVATCVSLGMRTTVVAPGLLAMTYFLLGVTGANSFDDLSGWGSFRLTMPLSRRDVVLARYGSILTLALGGLAVGLVVALALSAVALVVPLPGGLSSTLVPSEGDLLVMGFTALACLTVGSLFAALEVPLYFRFGNTTATQYLPLVPILAVVCPIIVLAGSGTIDVSTLSPEALAGALGLVASPAGVAACVVGMLALSAVLLGISAAISLHLYERREL